MFQTTPPLVSNDSPTRFKQIFSKFNKALRDYSLIDDGDKILVGLSGGKDSLALLEMLAVRMQRRVPLFTVEALHVRMKGVEYESDTSYLEEFCRERGVRLHIEAAEISEPRDLETTKPLDHEATRPRSLEATELKNPEKSRKPACFICSWNRRKALFTKAQELGCNKIALGHHRDDIIHTTLLNIFFQGQFSTMPAKLKLRKMPLTIIRPLCLVDEVLIKEYAEEQSYQKQKKLCPHEHETNRTTMAHLFEEIEKLSPEARFNIMHALQTEGKLIEI